MSDKLEINILLALERCGRLPLTLQLVLHGEHAFIFMGEEMDLLLLQTLTHVSQPFCRANVTQRKLASETPMVKFSMTTMALVPCGNTWENV